MDLQKLQIPHGIRLNIELTSNPGQKYQSRMIGYLHGKTVIITTPMLANDRPLLLRKDQEVVVRFFSNKNACAFKTQVKHICTTPYNYLHLSYPPTVEVGEIRKAERVLAKISVSVVNRSQPDYEAVNGAVVDISTTGAKLETVAPAAHPGDILLLTTKLRVGHVSRVVHWEARVVAELDRFEMANSVAAYGLEFCELTELDYLALHGFVYGQMVRGHTVG
ncbi:flagellar brake protein [Gynuella sp.]|uniref:flagellar brake protein n=1 Tax=Gynuella sp. TaxID=2969146 RepID=UPI003D141A90